MDGRDAHRPLWRGVDRVGSRPTHPAGHAGLDPDPRGHRTLTHPTNGLDDTVHQRVRLGILTVLAESKRADFGYLRETLELTDGNLARHLQVLGDAGYVKLEKTIEGNRPRTWVSATKDGRAALAAEVANLRTLLDAMRRA